MCLYVYMQMINDNEDSLSAGTIGGIIAGALLAVAALVAAVAIVIEKKKEWEEGGKKAPAGWQTRSEVVTPSGRIKRADPDYDTIEN